MLLVPVLLQGQVSIYYFNCTDDGSLFTWVVNGSIRDYGLPVNGVNVCPKESLFTISSKKEPTFKMDAVNAKMSGNGKYLFWNTGNKLFRASYYPEGLKDTVKLEYGGISQFAYDVSYDGSRVLACYDAPTLKGRCSPGYRMLMHFEFRDGKFVVTDTLSPPDTCKFVSISHLLPNGYVFWTGSDTYHLMQPIGSGKFDEIAFITDIPVNRPSFIVPQNGNSIFFSGYRNISGRKNDSVFALYECRFVNGNYTAPYLIREWENSPSWKTIVSVSPDGTHLVWTNTESDPAGINPDVTKAWSMHWVKDEWSEPEVVFSEIAGPSGRRLGYWPAVSNNSITWVSSDGHVVHCSGLHAGSLVTNITFVSQVVRKQNWLQSVEIFLDDTLVEKEQKLVDLMFVNFTADTLQLTPFTSTNYSRGYERMIPVAAHAWSSLSVDFSELSGANDIRQTWTVIPRDTIIIPVLVSFAESGQMQEITFSVHGDSVNGLVHWSIFPGVILKDIRSSPYDPFIAADGKTREQLARTRDGYILRTWYPNGQLHFETEYDHHRQPRGEWKYFSETGILQEKKIYRNKNSYSVKTWYLNGQIRSSGIYRKACKTGDWVEYFEDGTKKTETNFHRVWTLNIYLGGFGIDITMGTYARHYTEWYSNGQIMRHAQYGMNGQPKGKWEAWYDNGQINSIHTHRRRQQLNIYTLFDRNGQVCVQNPGCVDLLARLPQLLYEAPSHRHHGRESPF